MSEDAISQLVTDMMKADGKSGGLEKAIAEVNQNLQKIENIHDVSKLPYQLIEDVFRIANIMELEGTKQSMRFAADSKRRLLDSIAKIKAIEIQSPRTCEECPNLLQRNMGITKDRQTKERIVKEIADKFIPKERHQEYWKWLEKLHPVTFNPPK